MEEEVLLEQLELLKVKEEVGEEGERVMKPFEHFGHLVLEVEVVVEEDLEVEEVEVLVVVGVVLEI